MGKSYSQLSIEERTMIQTQLEMGIKPAAIALGLNRSASTLSRELSRNGWVHAKACCGPGRPRMAGGYRAVAAKTAPISARLRRTLSVACDHKPRCGVVWCDTGRRATRRSKLPAHWRLCIRTLLRCGFLMKPSTPRSTPCRVGSCARK